jgi:cell wall-associated NlpC family hydrolase
MPPKSATPPGKHPPVDIAGLALQWRGYGYVYGGNASSPGDWDCSSFVSYVLHQGGLSLPGGKWGDSFMPPNDHGPVVIDYAYWDGAITIANPNRGALCCWAGSGPNGHIGIAISGNQMVSALNPTDGVQVTGIVGIGPSGVPLIYRHVTGAATTNIAREIPISSPPKPGRESWELQIKATTKHFSDVGRNLHNNAIGVERLKIRRNG